MAQVLLHLRLGDFDLLGFPLLAGLLSLLLGGERADGQLLVDCHLFAVEDGGFAPLVDSVIFDGRLHALHEQGLFEAELAILQQEGRGESWLDRFTFILLLLRDNVIALVQRTRGAPR